VLTSALPSTIPVRGLENQSLNWAWLPNTCRGGEGQGTCRAMRTKS
jgi:hypothetical protein